MKIQRRNNKNKMGRKKFTLLVFVLGVVSTLVFIFYAKIANAAVANPRFVNKVYIKWNGDDYVDINPYDDTYKYEKGSTDCRDTIEISDFETANPLAKITSATLKTTQDGKTTCTDDTGYPKSNQKMDGVNVRKILGYKTSDDTIVLFAGAKKRTDSDCTPSSICEHLGIDLINGKPVMHTYVNPPKNEWNSPADKNRYKQLKDGAEVNTPDSTEKYLYVQLDAADPSKGTLFTLRVYFNFAHYDKKVGDIVLANNGKITPLPEESNIPQANGGGGTASTGDADVISCEAEGISLSWILCPVISGVQNLVGKLNDVINDLMTLPTDKFFDTTNSNVANQFYEAWSGFRYIAMGLLVIIALIMVLSQAIGVGPFDAYTIRKVLPRLLAAVVLVSLSWPLMKLAVDITNGVGHSVSGLIYGPFSDSLTKENPSLTIIGGALLGVVAGAFVFGVFGALAFVATAALSMLSGVATLIFREMLIMFLVVVAPVAIICSILPNTQTLWKKWSDYFLRALIVFPIFSGVIAIGQVFASIGPTLNGKIVGTLIQFVGYFGPYFMLPKIFAMSGGAVAAVGSVAQKATAGMRGGLSSFSKKRAAKNFKDMKTGERFAGNRFVPGSQRAATRFNNITRGLGTGAKGGFGIGRRGMPGVQGATETQANEIAKSAAFQTIANNDDALHAGTHATEQAARTALSARFLDANGNTDTQRVDDAVNSWKSTGLKFGNRNAEYAAARQLVSTGTGYDNPRDMAQTLARVSHGNQSSASALSGFANAETKKVGRGDLAPGFAALRDLVSEEAGLLGEQRPTGVAYEAATVLASRGQDPVTLLRGKPRQTENLAGALAVHLTEQDRRRQEQDRRRQDPTLTPEERDEAILQHNVAMEEVLQTAAQIQQLNAAKGYASTEVQAHVNTLLDNTAAIRASLQPLTQSGGPQADRWTQLLAAPPNPNDPRNP